MLKVGIIGIGNTGNQVAVLGKEKYGFSVIAINSSDKDFETIPDGIDKILLTQGTDNESQGSGKDRNRAKTYLKESIKNVLAKDEFKNFLTELDIVFIVSSTGGGTGSGTAPIMADILSSVYPDIKTILVGVLPVNDEGYSSHVNTLEYLDELYNKLPEQTYMLYDNDKFAGLPSHVILPKVNEEIVNDFAVLSCKYNYSTKLDSIDDRDALRLISFPGRLVVARLEDFKEKDCDNVTIEEMIIDRIKRNAHVEMQRDKKINASGIIVNLSQNLITDFNNNVPKVREFSGDPIHAFNHISINDDRKECNNVFYIMSGLTPVNDRINKISDRIDEIEEAQKTYEEENALSDVALSDLSNKISDKKTVSENKQFDIKDVFDKFGI